MEVEKLSDKFSRSGYEFEKIRESENYYIYKKTDEEGISYFEVFEKKTIKKMIDFEKRLFSDDMTERYPSDESFGVWAWCFKSNDKALKKFVELNKNYYSNSKCFKLK